MRKHDRIAKYRNGRSAWPGAAGGSPVLAFGLEKGLGFPGALLDFFAPPELTARHLHPRTFKYCCTTLN